MIAATDAGETPLVEMLKWRADSVGHRQGGTGEVQGGGHVIYTGTGRQSCENKEVDDDHHFTIANNLKKMGRKSFKQNFKQCIWNYFKT